MDYNYQVSVYTDRGMRTTLARDFRTLAGARAFFELEAAAALHRPNDTVLLGAAHCHGYGFTVLAAKSTDGHHVEFHRAYYDRLRARHRAGPGA